MVRSPDGEGSPGFAVSGLVTIDQAPEPKEQHSADGRTFIYKTGTGVWWVVFEGRHLVGSSFRTRQLAREAVRAAKVLLS